MFRRLRLFFGLALTPHNYYNIMLPPASLLSAIHRALSTAVLEVQHSFLDTKATMSSTARNMRRKADFDSMITECASTCVTFISVLGACKESCA